MAQEDKVVNVPLQTNFEELRLAGRPARREATVAEAEDADDSAMSNGLDDA